ncbi:hypothetical protein A3F65_00335 [Candidatus Saccharibacteria bacterium RIFCSPHIGHO2_12_FULL_47_16b]|nr:MAG: hypothetical protein A3F65_00335 [Candidatus Saccharibacteria bacterium RIFCSPHIGHO2_12_FULL_47_16b]
MMDSLTIKEETMWQYSPKQVANSMLMLFVGLTEMLLTLRVALRFFNANPDASFVNWAYTQTQTLLEPFRAVFTSTDVVLRGWVVDYVALFAMAAYAVAGYWLVSYMRSMK